MSKTAILIDGGFYRKRAYHFWGDKTPEDRAAELEQYCSRHIQDFEDGRSLYRIFYYDCPPVDTMVYHPLLNKAVDLSKTDIFTWSIKFFEELKKIRKVALRLGKLADSQAYYNLKKKAISDIVSGKRLPSDLKESDFTLSIAQKGVDMKIGVDIASVAYKKQVDQIILISGDSDFVPASKLARREGVDVVLDSMESPIKDDLFEHIDGLITHVNDAGIIRKP